MEKFLIFLFNFWDVIWFLVCIWLKVFLFMRIFFVLDWVVFLLESLVGNLFIVDFNLFNSFGEIVNKL